jgi:N-acetylmuramoyl-L-alanine amidase
MCMVDYAGAIWIPSPHFFNNRYGHTPQYIILHGTAGGSSAQGVAEWFQNPASEASTNYVVGQDGTVVECVAEIDAPFANGIIADAPGKLHDPWWTFNPNFNTISIEHVKPSVDNSDVLTAKQQQASFLLVRDICRRYHIPMRTADEAGGITGHFSMDPASRANCPGNYPWNALWAFLQEHAMIDIGSPGIAKYFQIAASSRWQCKSNGYLIGGEILKYYQTVGESESCGLSLLGLPKSNEIPGGKPGTVKQLFERGIVLFDPDHTIDKPPTALKCYLQNIESFYPLPTQVQVKDLRIADLEKTLASDALMLKDEQTQIALLKAQLTAALVRTSPPPTLILSGGTTTTPLVTIPPSLPSATVVQPVKVDTVASLLAEVRALEQRISALLPASH